MDCGSKSMRMAISMPSMGGAPQQQVNGMTKQRSPAEGGNPRPRQVYGETITAVACNAR